MGKQKVVNVENFELKKMKASELLPADYNPRKITKKAKKELQSYIKKAGLHFPSFVLNKRTGRLVGGHRRLEIIKELYGDIEVTVSIVDISEKEEIEANVKLNNKNLMGDWDNEKLFNMQGKFDINVKDFGFDDVELDLMFDEFKPEKIAENQVYSEYQQANMAKLKAKKKDYKKKIEKGNKEGTTDYTRDDDYSLILIFENNTKKREFLKKHHISVSQKYVQYEILGLE